MLLYLVQHAEAKREEEDPSRGLTEEGLRNITKVAIHLGKLSLPITKIFHSGKTRTLRTAQVLAEHLRPSKGITEIDGLAPMDEPEIWRGRIQQVNEHIALVGHLPHLGKLASLLLSGDKEKNIIDFRMGGVSCFRRFEDGHWSVEWVVIQEVIG